MNEAAPSLASATDITHVAAMPTITAEEVERQRAIMNQRLDAAYLNLTDHLADFRRAWDAGPAQAFIASARAGWNPGGAAWLDEQAESFVPAHWQEVAAQLQRNAPQEEDVDDADPREWVWWRRLQDDLPHVGLENSTSYDPGNARTLPLLADAKRARALFRHRDVIVDVPSLIADGERRTVTAFVDEVMADIEPPLASSIRANANLEPVVAILADRDHDLALTYLAYIDLVTDAIPPNFYAHVAGKGALWLMLEFRLAAVAALLCLDTAASRRIDSLVAWFAEARKQDDADTQAGGAVDAFVRLFEDMSQAAEAVHGVGVGLALARAQDAPEPQATRPTGLLAGIKQSATKIVDALRNRQR